jgi:hypothetical protein
MPIIILRGNNSISKKRITNLLVNRYHYKYCNLFRNSIEDENDIILRKSQWISVLINEGNLVLINGAFFQKETIDFFFKHLTVSSNLSYLLVRTNEDILQEFIDIQEHEIIVKNDFEYTSLMGEGIHKIILTLTYVEHFTKQISEFPREELTENFLQNDPDFKETTSYLLYSLPIHGFMAMIINILKLYYIDEDKEASINLFLELVKFVQPIGFNIRKGAKFYRVCSHDPIANYTQLGHIWYPLSSDKQSRVGFDAPILYIAENWDTSFKEVFANNPFQHPFVVFEIEAIKSFRINFIAPLNFERQVGASNNQMYLDYCRDCRKVEPKLLALKEEMLRVFIGEFWVYKKHFDRYFSYDFTDSASKLLLKRWKDTGLGYLSTQGGYRYNNFAIPASLADKCLQSGKVVILDLELLRKGSDLSFKFNKIKEGYVNPETREIDYYDLPE